MHCLHCLHCLHLSLGDIRQSGLIMRRCHAWNVAKMWMRSEHGTFTEIYHMHDFHHGLNGFVLRKEWYLRGFRRLTNCIAGWRLIALACFSYAWLLDELWWTWWTSISISYLELEYLFGFVWICHILNMLAMPSLAMPLCLAAWLGASERRSGVREGDGRDAPEISRLSVVLNMLNCENCENCEIDRKISETTNELNKIWNCE